MWDPYVFFTSHIVQSSDPGSNLYNLQVLCFHCELQLDIRYHMLW